MSDSASNPRGSTAAGSSGFRVPGAVWVVALVAATALAHRYLDDPFIVELILVVGGLVLPMVVDNDADLKKALAAIALLTRRPSLLPKTSDDQQQGMRSVERSSAGVGTAGIETVEVPPEPNRMTTYLWG